MHGWMRARQKAQRLHALQSKPHVQAQSVEVFLQAVQYTQAQKHRDFRESPGSCPGSSPAKDHSRQNARQRQRSIHESSAVLHSPRRRGYGCRRSGGRASFVVFVVRHATGIGTGSVEGRCVKKNAYRNLCPHGKMLIPPRSRFCGNLGKCICTSRANPRRFCLCQIENSPAQAIFV